jgi:hypothetical protein
MVNRLEREGIYMLPLIKWCLLSSEGVVGVEWLGKGSSIPNSMRGKESVSCMSLIFMSGNCSRQGNSLSIRETQALCFVMNSRREVRYFLLLMINYDLPWRGQLTITRPLTLTARKESFFRSHSETEAQLDSKRRDKSREAWKRTLINKYWFLCYHETLSLSSFCLILRFSPSFSSFPAQSLWLVWNVFRTGKIMPWIYRQIKSGVCTKE